MASARGAQRERGSIRGHVLFSVLGMCLVALGVRLFLFQRDCQAEMAQRAQTGLRRVDPIPGCRGKIFARGASGEALLLAASRQVPSCFADPSLIPPDQLDEVCRAVGEAIGMPPADVYARLAARPSAQFVWLKRGRLVDEPNRLTAEQAEAVRRLRVYGIGLRDEWERYYPNGGLAAHVVGFAGLDGDGLEGIELWAERYLRATDGRRVMSIDARRNPIANQPERYVPPVDGNHVELTIDPVIQRQLERTIAATRAKYRAESVVGVVMDPRTGEVVAMACEPTYDLNAFRRATRDERRNRAITDPYEPGSIFKPFTGVTALQTGAAHLGEPFNAYGGAYPVRRGRTIRDVSGHGIVTFEQAVYLSLNTVHAQLGQRLGKDRLFAAIRGFGFGQKTGIELRGEDAGLVNPLSRWTLDTIVSVPMGQEVGVTALQMVTGFCAIANEGRLMRPRVVRAIYAPDGEVLWDNSEPVLVRQASDPRVTRTFVDQVLAKVTTEGTAARTGRLSGWTSFGKTGTAQIPPYRAGQYTASYIAAAPVHEPRLVCLISVRRPDRSIAYYGGTVAGPAVKEVLEASLAYLGVPKDDPESENQSRRRLGAPAGH